MAFPIAMAGMGLLGGLAGAQGSKSSQTYTKQLAPETALEQQMNPDILKNYGGLAELLGLGPGAQDVTAGLDSQRGLAAMLQGFIQTGGAPGQQDFQQGNDLASMMFAGQRNQLQNNFQDQQVNSDRRAALMGRAGNDPILAAKLGQEQTRQMGQLDAEQRGFAGQYAMQLPQQRLQFASQFANVQGGLASQALQNKLQLLQTGQQLRNDDRNFRLGSASTTASTSSGGGLGGFISGALGGAGAGASIGSMFGGGGNSGWQGNTGNGPLMAYGNK